MPKDAYGSELKIGDKVVSVSTGQISYTIDRIDTDGNIHLKEIRGVYYLAGTFAKIADSGYNIPLASDPIFDKMADAIIELINSKPRSPLRSEIIVTLIGVNQSCPYWKNNQS